jgi:hypothetical protein
MNKNDMVASGSVTPEVIEKWKSEYGEIAKFTVVDKGQKKIVYVRTPSNKDIDYASSNLTAGKLTQYGITLFHSCQIGGDKIESDAALRTIGKNMNELIEDVEISLEKL